MAERKRKALPLDSPNWVPFVDIHRLFVARVGSVDLAARDMTSVLRSGTLRSMSRRARPSSKSPERGLQTPEFWANWDVSIWSNDLLVVPSLQRQSKVRHRLVTPLTGVLFFGWEPDLKKLGATTEAKAKPKANRKRRGGKRPDFDRAALEQLVRQHLEWTNKEIRKEFERQTGTKPSDSWIRKHAPRFRGNS
jgi:hypothetical protein